MGKALMVTRPGTSITSGDEITLFGTATDSTQEGQAQSQATEGATFSNLRVNIISGGSGTNNFQFRDNSANGQMLATRSGTGIAEDTVNTDVLSAGDLYNLAYTDTGTDSTYAWVSANVTFASGHGNFHGAGRHLPGTFDAENETRFIGLAGSLDISDGDTVEANQQWKTRSYSSFEALQVYVATNARLNNSTFRNRINGANGSLAVTFGTLVTGLIVDTSPADSLSDGDLINASVTLGAGVDDLLVSLVACTLKSSTNKSEIWAAKDNGFSRTASATAQYHPIGGFLTDAIPVTEAEARLTPGFDATVSNLRCYVSANTYTGDCTLKLIKNGSAVLTKTITAGATGWQENSSDTVTIDSNDELSYEIDEGTANSITIYSIGITFSSIDGNISSTGESVNTLSGASIAEAPITSAGESVNILAGASIAEAPITSAGESVATFAGESDVPAEGRISSIAESIATLAGASLADGAIASTAEALATLEGASLVAGAISTTGESLATLVGSVVLSGAVSSAGEALLTAVGIGIEGDVGPSWYHGTSKDALKNPWKKKRRKGPDDDEFMALFNYALSVAKKSSGPPQ